MTAKAQAAPLLDDPVQDSSQQLSPIEPTSNVLMFERLLRDPTVDVDKFERLLAMHERIQAQRAKMAFNSALSLAQKAMRPVAADATNPQTRSKYASYAALDNAIRPIYTNHGFGLSFDTGETPLELHVRVLCEVTHVDGHSKVYHVDMPADGKGAKGGDVMTRTHATGSALSYGQRYLLKLIFNIAVSDDDGNAASAPVKPPAEAPEGFDDWWTNLCAVADNGLPALEQMWRESNKKQKTKVFCDYASQYRRSAINDLKAKAAKVAAS